MLCQYSVNDGAKVATALNAKAPMIGPAKDPVPPSTQTSSAFVDVEKPADSTNMPRWKNARRTPATPARVPDTMIVTI